MANESTDNGNPGSPESSGGDGNDKRDIPDAAAGQSPPIIQYDDIGRIASITWQRAPDICTTYFYSSNGDSVAGPGPAGDVPDAA